MSNDTWLDDINEITEVEKSPEIDWSTFQKDIFDFVENGKGNALIEAVAGSGKTTSLIKALEFTDPNKEIAFVAFNKHIATELEKRAPSHVHISTLHSLGYQNLRSHFNYRGNPVQTGKLSWMFKDYVKDLKIKGDSKTADIVNDNRAAVLRLVGLSKGLLLAPNPKNLDHISSRYGILTNGASNEIFTAAKFIYEKSVMAISKKIDFDDMIFASASGQVPCKQFDFLFVDEGQDLNNAQIEMVMRSVKPNSGRVIVVADRKQSIYGFRGADTQAVPNFIEKLNATTLPLSITYRCPKSVVKLAQELVPQIQHAPNAIEGTISYIKSPDLVDSVQEGDMVLCRLNAPLVGPALELISNGVKAIILGREIGKGLTNLINKITKRFAPLDLDNFLDDLDRYSSNEVGKLMNRNKISQAIQLQDQCKTVLALSNGCENVREIKARIKTVFADDRVGVTFSSVHKAKGGEANSVFILQPELMPHPLAKQEWQLQEENNIAYVAYTRSKNTLYFVETIKS